MRISRILISNILCLSLLTSCGLDEETFTFVSGDDLSANGKYAELVAGAYNTLHFPFEWGNYHAIVNSDTDYQSGPTWDFGTIGAGNFYNEGSNTNFYKYYCQSVHRANYHCYLISKMANVPEKVKNNAMGELLFLKAWAQFNLVQFYGPIPLYKYSVSEGNEFDLPRSSVKEVYDHIIETLIKAESLMYSRLDSDYKKGHVCRGTAKALLAKVYATIGSASLKDGKIIVKGGPGSKENPDGTTSRLMPLPIVHEKNLVPGFEMFDSKTYYQLAKAKAAEVISEGEFALTASQEQLWSPANKNGSEFQFCLQTVDSDGSLFYNYISKTYLGWPNENEHGLWNSGYHVQRDHWLQTFEDWDDERITWGVKHRIPYVYDKNKQKVIYCFYPERDSVYVRKGENGYDPSDRVSYSAHLYGSKLMKFSAVTTPFDGNRSDFNWAYMRYAETLLIYAEAENELNGPTADAFVVIDQLNVRNNSTKVSDKNAKIPFSKEALRSYILEERCKEFASEGIRRFDLLRWGIYLQVMNAIGTTDENGVIKRREDKHLLLPLPLDVVNTNPYIDRNNPGW